MARLAAHSLLAGISGALGKEVVFKKYADGIVVTKMPDMSGVQPSLRQSERRELFQQAVYYAKAINRDPELKKAYAAKLKEGKSVFNYAIQEFMEREKERLSCNAVSLTNIAGPCEPVVTFVLPAASYHNL